MKKQYIYLSIAAGVLVVIFVILLLVQASINKSPDQTSVSGNSSSNSDQTSLGKSSNTNQPHSNTGPLSPEETGKEFYNWYITYRGDPLTSGAYKNSPYLSSDFKQLIQTQLAQDTSTGARANLIICTQNRSSNIVSELAAAEDFPSSETAVKVYIRENAPGGRKLHSMKLNKINNTWLISDIACIP